MNPIKMVKAFFAKREQERVIEAQIVAKECAMTAVARAVHPYLNGEQIKACLAEMDRLQNEVEALQAKRRAL